MGLDQLPPELLAAVSTPGGGRVVLICGAGCSVEPPTDLPLSRDLAADVFRRLVLDGVLGEGDCDSPEDLSAVADAVFEKLGRQWEVVERLPIAEMRDASPNEGTLIAAALLMEGVARALLTLNYDLSPKTALAVLGAKETVSVLRGPEDHSKLASINLVFLHRSVDADYEAWILRSGALDEDWGPWEAVIAQGAMSAPVVVFCGLGTPVGLLIETATRLRAALAEGTMVFQVDPGAYEDSVYAARLGLPPNQYVQLGWGGFMRQLAARIVAEHRAVLASACISLADANGWPIDAVDSLLDRAANLGLLGLGHLRATWMLQSRRYLPVAAVVPELIADLLLAIGTIESAADVVANIDADGLVELWREDRLVGVMLLGSGGGHKRWLQLERELQDRAGGRATFAVASGFVGGRVASSPPDDIVRGNLEASVITGPGQVPVLAADDIRASQDVLDELIAA